jgi:hypothetical protein
MNKTTLIQSIKEGLEKGIITPNDIKPLIKEKGSQKQDGSLGLFSRVIGFLGSVIAILGIVFFVALYWSNLGDIGQVIVTLGFGIAFYVSGSLLLANLKSNIPGTGFHIVGGILIPLGIFVLLSKLPESNTSLILVSSIIFTSLGVLYLVSDYLQKTNILTVFTYLFFLLGYVFGFSYVLENISWDIELFRLAGFFLLIAASSLFTIGLVFKNKLRNNTIKFFEGVGYGGFFYSWFMMVVDSPFEFTSLLVFAGGIILGSMNRIYSLLSFSFIALTMYIIYINTRYFSDIITWPIALIISGLVLIGSGYGFARLQSYLKNQQK